MFLGFIAGFVSKEEILTDELFADGGCFAT
jgi:hypothetical protein